MDFKIYFLIFFLFTSVLHAEQKSILFGHNLATTAQTLDKNQITAGTYVLAYGITDDLLIGTSPWMLAGYNLENIVLKLKYNLFEYQKISHQLTYFKSNPMFGEKYQQISMSYWLTHAIEFERYTLNTTFNYMYFWDENRPFSLRREPFYNQAQQFTLTTLHQFYFTDETILQFELGILGLNYKYPNLSAGASWMHIFSNAWSTQIGASFSKRFTGPAYPDYDDFYIKNYENYSDNSIHPEIQIQYWF